MDEGPRPPKTYQEFSQRFPKLREAWEQAREAERDGPLDQRAARLVKLGVAIGSRQEGPVHSAVRKARAAGIGEDEILHVVALAASTLGFPGAVAVFSWVRDELEGRKEP